MQLSVTADEDSKTEADSAEMNNADMAASVYSTRFRRRMLLPSRSDEELESEDDLEDLEDGLRQLACDNISDELEDGNVGSDDDVVAGNDGLNSSIVIESDSDSNGEFDLDHQQQQGEHDHSQLNECKGEEEKCDALQTLPVNIVAALALPAVPTAALLPLLIGSGGNCVSVLDFCLMMVEFGSHNTVSVNAMSNLFHRLRHYALPSNRLPSYQKARKMVMARSKLPLQVSHVQK